ncbi:MAG: lysophospholipase [Dehalococcoidales bacterium]
MDTAADAIEHWEDRFQGQDNTSLFSQTWRSKNVPEKAILVVLHGLKDHSSRYSELAVMAAQCGFTVYAFDMRGHGNSGGKRVYVNRFSDLVEDLAGFVKNLRSKNPGRPVFAFGHSMGGTTVTLAAVNNVIGFQGIILSAPALVPGEGISPLLVRVTGILGKLVPNLPLMKLPNEQFSRDPLVVNNMYADPLIYNKNAAVRTAAQLLNAMAKIQRDMEKFSVPVLILHGTADKLANPAGSKKLVERAKSSDKTLKLYPGLVHDLVHEPEKSQVLADIIEWLEKRQSSPLASDL